MLVLVYFLIFLPGTADGSDFSPWRRWILCAGTAPTAELLCTPSAGQLDSTVRKMVSTNEGTCPERW